jgi:hypothetical protein
VKKVFSILFLLLNWLGAFSQNADLVKGSLPLKKVIRFSDPAVQDWNPVIQNIREAPKPTSDIAEKKAMLDSMRRNRTVHPHTKQLRSAAPMPVLVDSFAGNPSFGVTPPDNTMAISNAGMIVSCVNTQIKILDTTGHVFSTTSLPAFANQLGFYSAVSDPRVIYDPGQDQFILVFFSGSRSTNSEVIVAFSQSNDPTGAWNFYQFSGNLLQDSTWSDYPLLSITNDDFFMTFNHLANDSFFPAGFKYSVVWQVNKQNGYTGDTMAFNYWHNIRYAGKPVWNICTVQGGSGLTGPNAYFLSVRPHDLSNDTVFLHQITNSYISGTAQLTTTMLRTNTPYGLPPNAPQIDGQHLATNDARILSALIENDRIHYVQNSIDPAYTSAGVYVGLISHVSSSPVATGQIIGYDTVDLGYPSIAYAGLGASDNRTMLTCSYLPAHGYPGTAAFYIDNSGNVSNMLPIKEGRSPVDMLIDSLERWGDYTTIQRKYNTPGVLWLNGSYTDGANGYQTQIAKLFNSDNSILSGIDNIKRSTNQVLYPNPAKNTFTVQFDLDEDTHCRFELIDEQGRLLRLLLDDAVDAGTNRFSFNTTYLSAGRYQLLVIADGNTILDKPVIISGQ